ncbi:hypothetical protein PtB15_7B110 [Puccinia triticina]|nr:hypothetical protein PtB15_7B110 [Puccinia triticina]
MPETEQIGQATPEIGQKTAWTGKTTALPNFWDLAGNCLGHQTSRNSQQGVCLQLLSLRPVI